MEINVNTIKDKYAVEQGYDCWRDLVKSYGVRCQITTSEFLEHENAVIQLIQYELKKKIANEQDLEVVQHSILNTENIK